MALSEMRSSLAGFPLFWHWHPCKLKGIGPAGWWVETWTGAVELIPSVPGRRLEECLGPTISDRGEPCDRCGWKREVLQVEQ